MATHKRRTVKQEEEIWETDVGEEDEEEEEEEGGSVHVNTRRAFLNPAEEPKGKRGEKKKKKKEGGGGGGAGEDAPAYRVTAEEIRNAQVTGETLLDFFGELNPEDRPTAEELAREANKKKRGAGDATKKRPGTKRLAKRLKGGTRVSKTISDTIEEGNSDSDSDELSSIASIPPEVTKDADIAIRSDPFAQCLTIACGFCSLSLADCFHTTPPEECWTYDSYRPYLKPSPRAALALTNDLIMKITKQNVTLARCIHQPVDGPIFLAVARMTGELMRKSIMDNPIKTVHTRVGSYFLDRDLNRAMEELYHALKSLEKNTSYSTIYFADPGMSFRMFRAP